MESSEKQKIWKRENYLDNKEYFVQRDKKRRDEFKVIVADEKKKPCADCKREYPPYVMEFAHRDRVSKKFNVSDLKNFSSETKLREEIAKCDVVCSNCHSIRTHIAKDFLPLS